MKPHFYFALMFLSFVAFAQAQITPNNGAEACYWIEPDNSYENPNVGQWPGSPGSLVDNYSNPITLPFNFDYFGTAYNVVTLTTKGTIALGGAGGYIDFAPSSFPNPLVGESTQQYNHICGFWSDFDFSNGELYYKITDDAFYINYIQVGLFPNNNNNRNTFQMIICATGSNVIPNGNNVQFFYKDMQWANSQMNGATNGLNATNNLAIVGCDKSFGNNHVAIGRFNTGTADYNGPYGISASEQDGVYWLNGKVIQFNTAVPSEANTPPAVAHNFCSNTNICQGENYAFEVVFTASETDQEMNLVLEGDTAGLTHTINYLPHAVQIFGNITAADENTGTHQFTITGFDSGDPEASNTIEIDYTISAFENPTVTITGDTLICAGSSTSLQATPGMDSYLWQDGSNGSSYNADHTAHYEVVAALNGCQASASFDVDELVDEGPILCNAPFPIETCAMDSIMLCVVQNFVDYHWIVAPSQTGEFIDPEEVDGQSVWVDGSNSGIYQITATDEYGCVHQEIQAVLIYEVQHAESTTGINGVHCLENSELFFPESFLALNNQYMTLYALSENVNGWGDSYITIEIIHANSEITSIDFSSSSAFENYQPPVSLYYGDSIAITYHSNGQIQNNSLWFSNCESDTPIIFNNITDGLIWSGLATCTSYPLTGSWVIDGPSGWTMSDINQYNSTFNTPVPSDYQLCFNLENCQPLCYDVEIIDNPTLELTAEDSILCFDETLELQVSCDATFPITWSGPNLEIGESGLNASAGPFSNYVNDYVYVQLDGCNKTDSLHFIYQPSYSTIPNDHFYICNNSLLIDPIPTVLDYEELQYNWSVNGQTGSQAFIDEPGNYLLILNNACSTDSIDIVVEAMNSISGTTSAEGAVVVCPTNEAEVYSTQEIAGATEYIWVIAPAAAGTIISNSNSASIDFSDEFYGTAMLYVAAVNECSSTDIIPLYILVTICDDVQNIQRKVNIYPNPNKGDFTIELDEQIEKIEMNNLLGQKFALAKDKHQNLENFATGNYLLHVYTKNNHYISRIFIE
jgi:hypothetical protein